MSESDGMYQSEAAKRQDATIQHLRDAAAARVETTSLRGVAREIGLSPTGLKKFLLGTAPYSPTLRRLRRWYLQYGASLHPVVGLQDARVALAVLTNDLSPLQRRETTDKLLTVLGASYDRQGRPRPGWVTDLCAAPGGPSRDTHVGHPRGWGGD